MPQNKRSILDLAEDYAEGAELASALTARSRIAPNQTPSRSAWTERWLGLSDWARQRELGRWERQLDVSLNSVHEANASAELQANEELRRLADAEARVRCACGYQDPSGTSEVSHYLVETLSVQQDAVRALHHVAETRCTYYEVRAAIEMAQLRASLARQHFAELAQTRRRTAARTFLVTLLFIAMTALLLHYRMPTPR